MDYTQIHDMIHLYYLDLCYSWLYVVKMVLLAVGVMIVLACDGSIYHYAFGAAVLGYIPR
jgi:hypothetical protein